MSLLKLHLTLLQMFVTGNQSTNAGNEITFHLQFTGLNPGQNYSFKMCHDIIGSWGCPISGSHTADSSGSIIGSGSVASIVMGRPNSLHDNSHSSGSNPNYGSPLYGKAFGIYTVSLDGVELKKSSMGS